MDSDFDSENFEEEPTDLFEAQCFTKHGFDMLMISSNIKNMVFHQNVVNNPLNKADGDREKDAS